jgi:hypothetical protein
VSLKSSQLRFLSSQLDYYNAFFADLQAVRANFSDEIRKGFPWIFVGLPGGLTSSPARRIIKPINAKTRAEYGNHYIMYAEFPIHSCGTGTVVPQKRH